MAAGAATSRSRTGRTLPVVEFSIGSTSLSSSPVSNAAKAAAKLGKPTGCAPGNSSRTAW